MGQNRLIQCLIPCSAPPCQPHVGTPAPRTGVESCWRVILGKLNTEISLQQDLPSRGKWLNKEISEHKVPNTNQTLPKISNCLMLRRRVRWAPQCFSAPIGTCSTIQRENTVSWSAQQPRFCFLFSSIISLTKTIARVRTFDSCLSRRH